jgi:hypothetical protein
MVSILRESQISEREVLRALWAMRFPGRPNGQGDAEDRGRAIINGNASVLGGGAERAKYRRIGRKREVVSSLRVVMIALNFVRCGLGGERAVRMGRAWEV